MPLLTMLAIAYNMLTKILLTVALIPIKMVTMFYIIPDILLKVSLNTNKTGHHVVRYIKLVTMLYVIPDTFNNVSGITYNMVTSFIGV
jgi:hypothetical protein